MNKLRTITRYLIIAVLFVITISTTVPVEVNAADDDDPYFTCIINPMKK